MEEIRFDDIDTLQTHVSEEYGDFCESVEITQEMVNQFAEVTGDHQWIHVDVERCEKESPFGGPIVHGFFTLSLLPMLGTRAKPAYKTIGVKNAVNYGSDKLRFLSPVPVGSKVHSRTRLVSAEAGKKGVRLEQETAIHVVGNDRPAVIYNMITLLQG
ncbi:MAG: MaoC family dehydratase [bacterium]|nr:dehydratase [Deltaproteobacteria bacterium]MCP4907908.1 MaoC family dehydratase [bacterium]